MVVGIIVVPTMANFFDTETSTNNVVQSNWYNYSWLYREPITINNTGSALTNYQMQLTLNLASLIPSHMLASGNDIRFTASDGQTLLNYWIESISTPSAAVIWVNIPSIPVGSPAVTIYMYYGNSGAAAASSGSSTFIFFDDFENGVSQWTVTGNGTVGTFTQSTTQVEHGTYSGYFNKTANGTLTITSPTFTNTANPVIVEYYMQPGQTGATVETQIDNSGTIGPDVAMYSTGNIRYNNLGTWTNVGGTASYSSGSWYNIQLNNINWLAGANNDTYAIWVGDPPSPYTPTSRNTGVRYVTDLNNSINQIVFTATGNGSGNRQKAYIDLVKVRVYAATVPTLGSVGAEQ
jgi:hypothetical protein